MQTIRSQVAACYDRFRQRGTYNVIVSAAADGTVQSAMISGNGGLQTSECIVAAARQRLRMPPSADGEPYSITYPFILR